MYIKIEKTKIFLISPQIVNIPSLHHISWKISTWCVNYWIKDEINEPEKVKKGDELWSQQYEQEMKIPYKN